MAKEKRNMKDWEDLGWQSMSGLLDHEMPQQKKRRRLVIWFFFLGLIAAFTVAYFSRPSINDDINQGKEPVAENKNHFIDRKADSEIDNGELLQASLSNNKFEVNKTELQTNIDPQNQAGKSQPILSFTEVLNTEKQLNSQIPSKWQKKPTDLDNDFIHSESQGIFEQTEPVDKPNTIIVDPLAVSLQRVAYEDVFNWPVVQFEEIGDKDQLVDNSPKRFQHGLGALIGHTLDGYFSGGGLNYQMQVDVNKHIFIHSGVSFLKYNSRNRDLSGYSLKLNSEFEDAGLEIPEIENEADEMGESLTSQLIRQSLRLSGFSTADLSFGLGYHLTNRFDFWIGSNIRYTWGFDKPGLIDTPNSNEQLISRISANNWFVNPKIGINYQLLDRLQLGVNYEMGSRHIYTDQNEILEFDPLSYFHAQASYRF